MSVKWPDFYSHTFGYYIIVQNSQETYFTFHTQFYITCMQMYVLQISISIYVCLSVFSVFYILAVTLLRCSHNQCLHVPWLALPQSQLTPLYSIFPKYFPSKTGTPQPPLLHCVLADGRATTLKYWRQEWTHHNWVLPWRRRCIGWKLDFLLNPEIFLGSSKLQLALTEVFKQSFWHSLKAHNTDAVTGSQLDHSSTLYHNKADFNIHRWSQPTILDPTFLCISPSLSSHFTSWPCPTQTINWLFPQIQLGSGECWRLLQQIHTATSCQIICIQFLVT